VSSSDEPALRFIAASFPSVWALEVVLALRRERRTWTHEELVATLRASELVVSKALAALVAAGLASVDDEGTVYLPVNRETDECMDQVEQLYRTRANAVRRVIISATTSSATAFANAFKLRGGSNE
jgi:predicted transcriptional regulator